MSTFSLLPLSLLFGTLLTTFLTIETKPTEDSKDGNNLTINIEGGLLNEGEYNVTSELTALATSDLTFNLTASSIFGGNISETEVDGLEDILKASSDDDMFSVVMDQSGDGNWTESLEDERLISEESGSGGGNDNGTVVADDPINGTQIGMNGTEGAWSTDSVGSPIPALMFA